MRPNRQHMEKRHLRDHREQLVLLEWSFRQPQWKALTEEQRAHAIRIMAQMLLELVKEENVS